MPGIRKPANVHALTGAMKKDPQRFRKREGAPANENPIGRAPAGMTPDQRKAWSEIVKNDPGCLTQADRLVVEHIARLVAEIRAGADVSTSKQSLLGNLLHKIGQTPLGRNYVQVPKASAPNPFDEF